MPALRPALLLLTCLGFGLTPAIHAAPADNTDEPAFDAPLSATPGITGLWELYREARDSDPRVQAAEARRRSSSWTEREAFGQLLPQLAVSASGNRTAYNTATSEARYGTERYQASLSQVLYAPAAWHGYRRAQALARQQDAQSRDEREQAALDLVERYFKTLAARDELDLVEAELAATQRQHQQLEAMFARQMATITDLLKVQARVDTLLAARIDARNRITISLEALSELLGRPVQEPLQRIDQQAIFVMPPREREAWVQLALENNPALQAHQQAREAAESALDQARAGHRPEVSLSLTAQQSNIGYENSLNPRTDTYVATLGMSLPLYSGGSTSARVESASELLNATSHEQEGVRREVVRQTRAAYHTTESSLQRIGAARTALLSARRAREASEQAFARGVEHAIDVLDRVREEYSARRDLLQAQYDFILNLLALQRWSGSRLDVDIRRTAAWLSDRAD